MNGFNLKFVVGALVLGTLASSYGLHAQERRVWEEYGSRVGRATQPTQVGSAAFGEEVDTYMGGISFKMTDVDLPGNNDLPVRFERSFRVRNNPIPGVFYRSFAMADWEVQLPSLSADFAPNWEVSLLEEPNRRCSVPNVSDARPLPIRVGTEYVRPDEYWDGVNLQIPEGGGELLYIAGNVPVPGDAATYYWTAGDNIRISCLPSLANGSGEGFLAVAPNGNRYRFDWMAQDVEPSLVSQTAESVSNISHTVERRIPRSRNSIYPTRVEDKHGNWVAYTYANTWNQVVKLTRIESSDGRWIAVRYDTSGNISQVEANGRLWNYGYVSDSGKRSLGSVRLPDQTQWQIDLRGLGRAHIAYAVVEPGDQVTRNCTRQGTLMEPSQFSGSMVHPSGLLAQFTVGIVLHGRSNVPLYCKNVTRPFNDRSDDIAWIPPAHHGLSLLRKELSGVGIAPMLWTYEYSTGSSYKYLSTDSKFPVCPPEVLDCTAPLCTSDDCAGAKGTTITAPDGSSVQYRYGNSYRYNEGKLLGTVHKGSNGETLRSEQLRYDFSLADGVYPARWGVSPRYRQAGFPSELHRPLVSKTITQDGVNFALSVQQFDSLARPVIVRKQSSAPGAAARSESTQYHDNVGKWVMGQAKSLSVNGVLAYETQYNAQAAPEVQKEFGRVAQTIGYGPDGTVSSVRDGNGNLTALGAWKLGVPQRVTFADGASVSAVVDDNGWITQAVDEGGYATSYQYDVMGRIVRTAYAAGDSVAWNPVVQTFERVAGAEYGLPAGHWRHTVETGAARKISYLDAMWRPLLVREFDANNVAATERFSGIEYDHEGRKLFASYPSTSSNSDVGVWTRYDALGRVTGVSQNSELGLLTTTTVYASDGEGAYSKVTRADGRSVLTRFQAFDEPAYESALVVSEPEGVVTRIARDVFARPLTISRGSADGTTQLTRSYAYDAQGRLCRQIEPETGATLTGYDGAGNVTWSAAGLAANSACSASGDGAGTAAVRVTRTYDSRNRLRTLVFPDGNGDQLWRYTSAGKPDQIVTKAAGSPDVINVYAYNRRGLLTGESGGELGAHNWSVGYAYDSNATLSGVRYPSGLFVDYAPNALGQATRAGTYAQAVSYHPNGGMKGFAYGNGIQHTMQQNARQLPARVQDGAVLDNGYTYDSAGNVMAIQDGLDASRTRTMQYDGLDRLVRAVSPSFGGDGIARFSYDAIDNLRSSHLGGKRQFNYLYDVSNRLTNIRDDAGATTIGLSYDAKGNLKSKNGMQFAFDHGNRLRQVAGVESYRYDGHGRRVANIRPGGASRLSFYGFDGVLRRQQDAAGKGDEYIYLNGSLVAQVETGEVMSSPVLTLPSFSPGGAYAVAWTSVASASTYELQMRVGGGAWSALYSGAATTWNATGHSSGIYSYRVRSCKNGACGEWSAEASVRVQLPPSGVPTASVPALSTDGRFTVSWTQANGATDYRLEENVNGGGWSTIATTSATSHALAGKSAGSYAYRVAGCAGGACGTASPVVTVLVAFPPSGVPVLSAPTRSPNGAYVVQWAAVAGANRYVLEESANGAGWQQVHAGAAASLAVSGKMAGTYSYRASACSAGGCGNVSATVVVVVLYPPSGAATISVPSFSPDGSYTVSWTSVATASGYLLEESVNGGAWTPAPESAGVARTYSGRAIGQYSYRVRAANVSGVGPYSSVVSINVLRRPSAPQLSGPTYNGENGYVISWNAGDGGGSHSYRVELSANGGAWGQVAIADTLWHVINRPDTGSYGIRIQACNLAGCSDYSNVVGLNIAPEPIPATPSITYSVKTQRKVGATLQVSCSVRWTVSQGTTRYELVSVPTSQVQYSGPLSQVTRSGSYYCASSHVVRACNATGCSANSVPFRQETVDVAQ